MQYVCAVSQFKKACKDVDAAIHNKTILILGGASHRALCEDKLLAACSQIKSMAGILIRIGEHLHHIEQRHILLDQVQLVSRPCSAA